MLSAYPACFYKEKNGVYSVIFPDLNYLSTYGNNLNNALTMAVDCLAGYLYTAKKDGDLIPEPSEIKLINPVKEIKKLDLDIKFEEMFTSIVTVDVDDYAKKHFRKNEKKRPSDKIGQSSTVAPL
jgi:predicted RNase H-like HicB family nuclease